MTLSRAANTRLNQQLCKLPYEDADGVAALERPMETELQPCEVCSECERAAPRTMLELWLQQRGGSFDSLGVAISEEPELVKLTAGRAVSKNLIFRLNHQEPGWVPTTPIAIAVQAAILRRSGLRVEHLQNELPNAVGYSCHKRLRRRVGFTRERRSQI